MKKLYFTIILVLLFIASSKLALADMITPFTPNSHILEDLFLLFTITGMGLLVTLPFTIITEGVVAFLLKYRTSAKQKVILLTNICTNIPANLIYTASVLIYPRAEKGVTILIIELVVIFVEYKIFTKFLTGDKKKALSLSIILNAVSASPMIFILILRIKDLFLG
ncbi:MAG: hypothetical protein GY793_01310 [Proteobacteria bacterium]|nr:hypothetical protein [Pseudomonadota bacterium]